MLPVTLKAQRVIPIPLDDAPITEERAAGLAFAADMLDGRRPPAKVRTVVSAVWQLMLAALASSSRDRVLPPAPAPSWSSSICPGFSARVMS